MSHLRVFGGCGATGLRVRPTWQPEVVHLPHSNALETTYHAVLTVYAANIDF